MTRPSSAPPPRWSRERVAAWYDALPWLVGFNYLPRTAVNWTEMWQAGSFDPTTIEQELVWAEAIGLNAIRTNLPHVVWLHDPGGLLARLDAFLGAASARGMRTMLCLFDDCAFSGREPYPGPQDPPVPGIHNSGGAASPGREVVRDRDAWPGLRRYVEDVVSRFSDDARVLAWDVFNEPGNESVFTRPERPHPDGGVAIQGIEPGVGVRHLLAGTAQAGHVGHRAGGAVWPARGIELGPPHQVKPGRRAVTPAQRELAVQGGSLTEMGAQRGHELSASAPAHHAEDSLQAARQAAHGVAEQQLTAR